MLEKYIESFNKNDVIHSVMQKRQVNRTAALSILRKEIPREPYFQEKIKKGLKVRYPSAFVVKISQGMYSEGGIPDISCIVDGHFFGFEVKRPIFGKPEELQKRAVRKIEEAGGTAAFISWPEEAYRIIDAWREANGSNEAG